MIVIETNKGICHYKNQLKQIKYQIDNQNEKKFNEKPRSKNLREMDLNAK